MKYSIRNFWFQLILILSFIVVATVLFFVFNSHYRKDQRVVVDNQVEELQEEVQKLTFEQDVIRFFEVYFYYPFDSLSDKKRFIDLEYSRFSFYVVNNELDIEHKKELLENIKAIKEKVEANNLNFEIEHDRLLVLWDEMGK
jgi:hypothetical protein